MTLNSITVLYLSYDMMKHEMDRLWISEKGGKKRAGSTY